MPILRTLADLINTTDVVLRAAAAAGIRNYVTSIDTRNAHATVATEVVIKDGATVIWRQLLPAAMAAPVEITFRTPLRGTAATGRSMVRTNTVAIYPLSRVGFSGGPRGNAAPQHTEIGLGAQRPIRFEPQLELHDHARQHGRQIGARPLVRKLGRGPRIADPAGPEIGRAHV